MTPDYKNLVYSIMTAEIYSFLLSQQHPGYLLSFQVPPIWLPFSTMMKSRLSLRRIMSIAVHSPNFRISQICTINIEDMEIYPHETYLTLQRQ
jgi:hypothetical protein